MYGRSAFTSMGRSSSLAIHQSSAKIGGTMRIQKIIGIVVLALLLLSGITVKSLLSSQASPGKRMSRIQPGSIDGQVLDSQGQPVARAKLHVLRVGGNPTGRVIFHWSRDDGRFSIDGLEHGVYDVFVSKEN